MSGKVLENMKAKMDEPEDLPGFDSLKDDDKEKVREAWEAGMVPEYQEAEDKVGCYIVCYIVCYVVW